MRELHAIVLAAGASTRFGSPKQLAIVSGAPMLQLVLNRAIELCGDAVTVVLGAHAAQLAPVLSRTSASPVINLAWQEGLAASIRTGMEQVPDSCAGVLLMLGDQVAVGTGDLQRLVDAWQQDRHTIAAAQYAGGHGVPAIFPHDQFSTLRALRGTHGARKLLRNPMCKLVGVPMANAALDVDTPGDLLSAMGQRDQNPV